MDVSDPVANNPLCSGTVTTHSAVRGAEKLLSIPHLFEAGIQENADSEHANSHRLFGPEWIVGNPESMLIVRPVSSGAAETPRFCNTTPPARFAGFQRCKYVLFYARDWATGCCIRNGDVR